MTDRLPLDHRLVTFVQCVRDGSRYSVLVAGTVVGELHDSGRRAGEPGKEKIVWVDQDGEWSDSLAAAAIQLARRLHSEGRIKK